MGTFIRLHSGASISQSLQRKAIIPVSFPIPTSTGQHTFLSEKAALLLSWLEAYIGISTRRTKMAGVGEPLPMDRAHGHAMLSYNNTVVSPHEPVVCPPNSHQLSFQLIHSIQHELSAPPSIVLSQYPHFAMIYSNQDGNIAVETSPSLAESASIFFTPELQERFAQAVSLRSPTMSLLPGSLASLAF